MFVLWLLLVCYRIVATSQAARNTSQAENRKPDGRQE